MVSTKPIGAVLIGTFLMLPMLATAQKLSVSGSANVEATYKVNTARETSTGKATSRLNGLPPGVPTTGGRAVATGTKPIPPRAEEARQKMMGKRSEILKRMVSQVIKRMNAMIDRLTKLADRLDSRITKEKARGVDTSKAEANTVITYAKLAEARAEVAVAEAAVAGAIIAAETSDSSTKPMDAGKPVREALNKARVAVFAAHKALVQAIASLRGTREINGRATTTNSASVTP